MENGLEGHEARLAQFRGQVVQGLDWVAVSTRRESAFNRPIDIFDAGSLGKVKVYGDQAEAGRA